MTKELALGDSHDKPIIPVCYKICEIPSGMEYQLAGLQFIDFTSQPFEEAVGQLVDSLPAEIVPSTQRLTMEGPKPFIPEKVKSRPAKSKDKKKKRWVIMGVIGILLLAGLCLGGILVANLIVPQPTQKAVIQEVTVDPNSENTSEPDEMLANVLAPESSDALIEELVIYLNNALQSEIDAYKYGNPTLVETYYGGDALLTIQNNIINLNQQGRFQEAYIYPESYIVDAREINEDKYEVDTCEYWSIDTYNWQNDDLVGSSAKTLIPQTYTIERVSGSIWLITGVSFYAGKAFCQ